MNILYIGGGFVGACSAAVSADSGHQTLVFDVDTEKVRKLSSGDRDTIQSCLHEEGLGELLIRNKDRITFTTDIAQVRACADTVDAVFLCLPTPEKDGAEGETDLRFYRSAIEMVGPVFAARSGGKQEKRIVFVNKSTVPIGMIDLTAELLEKEGVKNFGIVSNPEFLVEGKAISGSLHPDRVVLGAASEEDFALMRRVYQRFHDATDISWIEVNPYEAACGKLLANYMLFNKVVNTYDVVGRTCEHFSHVSFEAVRKILSSDPRIGSWGLYNSMFSGGSCFIKDAASLAHQLETAGTHAHLVRGTLEANVFQRDHFLSRAETQASVSFAGARVAVLGLAFKQDTNDIRNSGAIGIIQQLLGAGVQEVRVYDPAATDMAKWYFDASKNPLYGNITYCASEGEAIAGTSVGIICTDWPQFKSLAPVFRSTVSVPYLIMDGRRSLSAEYVQLQKDGYSVIAVGSPFMKGDSV
jgi:UDPglucose 6-dehydrogenase